MTRDVENMASKHYSGDVCAKIVKSACTGQHFSNQQEPSKIIYTQWKYCYCGPLTDFVSAGAGYIAEPNTLLRKKFSTDKFSPVYV